MSQPTDDFTSSSDHTLPDDAIIRTNLPDLTEVNLKEVRETLAKLHGTPLGDATQQLLREIETDDPIVAGFGSSMSHIDDAVDSADAAGARVPSEAEPAETTRAE